MIIDRTWNKNTRNYIVSYLDENGNRKMYNKYIHHWSTYEYDDNGEYDTWNNRKCNRVYKDATQYSPNEFDELEFLYNLEHTNPQLFNDLHAPRSPRTYVFDIETEYVEGQFPYPDKAAFRIVSISLVGPDCSCIVYGLHDLTEEQKNRFRDRYLDWINNNEFAKLIVKDTVPKVLYQNFSTEDEMLHHFFERVLPRISCLSGWNTNNFDFLYLTNRITNLWGRGEAMNAIKNCSPIKEINWMKVDDGFGNTFKIPTPAHTLWLDEMQLVKDYDYVLRPYESYSLDYVGTRAVNAQKIKYEGSLLQLYERDYEWYYFYNAIDSLIVMLIHHRLKCVESPAAVSSLTLVPLLKSFGQVALTTANVFYEFYHDNKHVVYEEKHNVKVPYEGAFCACVPGRYKYSVCSDFASLYPSTVITCNFSFENFEECMIGPDSLGRYTKANWSEQEIEDFKKNADYFVSAQNNVYKNDKDYAFRKMMRRLLAGRGGFKYTGNDIESDLLPEIDRLIEEKKKVA